MAKVLAWTKTAPRTYMSAIVGKDNAHTSVVIKGVDDLFFIYTKKIGTDGPYKQIGFEHRLMDAKAAVNRVAGKIGVMC